MTTRTNGLVTAARTITLAALCTAPALADGWNEGVNGDLSGNQALPTPVTLTANSNTAVSGLVGGTDTQDWLTFTVPAGATLTAITLTSYASSDAQGFMGIQAGSSFVGSPFAAGSYLGYAHYGTGATNGALPPTNLIGADMLPLMGNTTLAAGAAGFTPPLGAGTYTLLIQQLGAATEYTFTFTLTPTPGAAAALGLAGLASTRRRR